MAQREQGERRRTVRWDDPIPSMEAAGRLAGLPFFEAIRDGRLPAPPVSQLLGFTLAEIEAERAALECEPVEAHYNPIGSVHGGIIRTLLDSALSCAVQTTLPAGTGYMTTEVQVNLVRPVVTGTGRLRGEGRGIRTGGCLATAEARLTDASGKLDAHAVGTCLLFRAR